MYWRIGVCGRNVERVFLGVRGLARIQGGAGAYDKSGKVLSDGMLLMVF